MNMTVVRSTDHVFCRKSINWHLAEIFLCLDWGYGFGEQDHKGPLAVNMIYDLLTLITWLRQSLSVSPHKVNWGVGGDNALLATKEPCSPVGFLNNKADILTSICLSLLSYFSIVPHLRKGKTNGCYILSPYEFTTVHLVKYRSAFKALPPGSLP